MRTIAMLACTFALAGCGSWSKPGGTAAELEQDRRACELQAAEAYPPQIMAATPPTQAARTTCANIYGQAQCQQTGMPQQTTQTDLNIGARSVAFERCLKSRGYRYSSGPAGTDAVISAR